MQTFASGLSWKKNYLLTHLSHWSNLRFISSNWLDWFNAIFCLRLHYGCSSILLRRPRKSFWWMCYQTNNMKRSPSSTLQGHQSHPVWGKSSSAWRLGRLHPARGTRGICRSSLGSPSMELHLPGAKPFSGNDGRALRRLCWHTSQAYLAQKRRKYNWNKSKHRQPAA